MSVAGVMYVYGGGLVGAGLLGLDHGVPTPGPPQLMPLSAALGCVMLLAGLLSTPAGPHPPKKGEPGFARRGAARRRGGMRLTGSRTLAHAQC
jgi:hypothetical protein